MKKKSSDFRPFLFDLSELGKKRTLLCLILCLGLFSCQQGVEQTFGSLSGIVGIASKTSGLSEVIVSVVGADLADTTETDGSFSFQNLPAELITLHFAKEHYASQLLTVDMSAGQNVSLSDTLYLSKDGCTFAGIVLERFSGKPVANATVVVAKAVDSLRLDSVVTDTVGFFVLSNLSYEKDGYCLFVSKLNHQSSVICTTLSVGDSCYSETYLQKYKSLKGKVFEKDSSSPLINVQIAVGPRSVLSDAMGLYSLKNLLPSDTQYAIEILKEGYFSQSLSFSWEQLDTLNLQINLIPKLVVHGFVYKSDSITPINQAMVLVDDTTLYTNSNGRFALNNLMPKDTGTLFTVIKDGFDTVFVIDTINRADTVVGPIYLKRRLGAVKATVLLQGQKSNSGTTIEVRETGQGDIADSLGVVCIADIPEGIYSLSLINPSFEELSIPITISARDTAKLDTMLVVQRGTISTAVDWRQRAIPYTISGPLHINQEGSLTLHEGTFVTLLDSAKLTMDGAFQAVGIKESPVLIHGIEPATSTTAEIQILGNGSTGQVQHTWFVNVMTTLVKGPRIKNALFICKDDLRNDPLVVIANGVDTATFDHCDFVWYQSKRESILLHDSVGASGALFTNSIFYQKGDAADCRNFLLSKSYTNTISSTLKYCNLFSSETLPSTFLSLMHADTTAIYQVTPEYSDLNNLDLRLKSTSVLVDKSSDGGPLGALGVKQK